MNSVSISIVHRISLRTTLKGMFILFGFITGHTNEFWFYLNNAQEKHFAFAFNVIY